MVPGAVAKQASGSQCPSASATHDSAAATGEARVARGLLKPIRATNAAASPCAVRLAHEVAALEERASEKLRCAGDDVLRVGPEELPEDRPEGLRVALRLGGIQERHPRLASTDLKVT